MEDWNVNFVNKYLAEHHGDKVECKVTDTKGRILVSNRSFRKGDVILEERPLHIVTAAEKNEAYATINKLCKSDPDTMYQDPLWYWAAVSSLTTENIGNGPKKGSLPPISLDTQNKILCLYHEPIVEVSEEAKTLVRALNLSADAKLVDELLRAWILNCFDHSEKPQGYASYFGASFMSHSCHPNAIWHFAEGTDKEDTFVLNARRDIEAGDEICISYLPEQGLLHSAAAAEGLAGAALSTAACRGCGAKVGEGNARRLLAAETELDERLQRLDAELEKRAIGKALKEPDVQHMLRIVGDTAAGSVGPQHWLCDRLWSHLADWYDQGGRPEDACRMFRLRVAYQRAAYASLHGELAWTLEAQADMLLRHAGVLPGSQRLAGLDDAAVQRMARCAAGQLEEGTGILRELFGGTHSYFRAIDRRRARLDEFFATGRWPKAAGKRKREDD
eukprot:CAMPEP_0176323086 /NCGR_PEP_ID=MMETSP0121_2-20121125/72207_1 /TAXON_ID=160619 /ORGANISM="Kryptoperidinium foliaceum, Strain CCMP 1326" /LENGTH=446 /DNA_ID=CAMNT_0017665597 /DNA_START=29 /DNA_END=1368 /DNA_ORIENTATION=+